MANLYQCVKFTVINMSYTAVSIGFSYDYFLWTFNDVNISLTASLLFLYCPILFLLLSYHGF